jgi:hypothetical protein
MYYALTIVVNNAVVKAFSNVILVTALMVSYTCSEIWPN